MNKRLQQWLAALVVRPRHWFAWLVSMLVALALILILVPGECVRRTGWRGAEPVLLADQRPRIGKDGLRPTVDPDAPKKVYEYEHGWPWTYLRRAKGYDGRAWPALGDGVVARASYPQGNSPIRLDISWSMPDAWPFASDRSQWRFGVLVLDVVIAVGILIFATIGAERWIRRRKSLLRLRLFDLIATTTVVALALGWWQWHLRQQEIEREILLKIHRVGGANSRITVEDYISNPVNTEFVDHTPVWLRRLLGTEYLMPWCRHLRSPFGGDLSAKELDRGAQLYSQLYYLESAKLRAGAVRRSSRKVEGFSAAKNVRNSAP